MTGQTCDKAYYNFKFGCRNPECEEFQRVQHEEKVILTIDERLAAKATGFLYYRHAQRRETKMRRNGASG